MRLGGAGNVNEALLLLSFKLALQRKGLAASAARRLLVISQSFPQGRLRLLQLLGPTRHRSRACAIVPLDGLLQASTGGTRKPGAEHCAVWLHTSWSRASLEAAAWRRASAVASSWVRAARAAAPLATASSSWSTSCVCMPLQAPAAAGSCSQKLQTALQKQRVPQPLAGHASAACLCVPGGVGFSGSKGGAQVLFGGAGACQDALGGGELPI